MTGSDSMDTDNGSWAVGASDSVAERRHDSAHPDLNLKLANATLGVGSVANSFGSFNSDSLLPSIGAGVRYMASKKYRVNVSMDYAVGRDFHGLYFYIGEAF